jgi:hypothetical protein
MADATGSLSILPSGPLFNSLHTYTGPQHVDPKVRVELVLGTSCDSKGSWACKILYSNFREAPFHALG